MSRPLLALLLLSSCQLAEEAAQRPGELKRGLSETPAREEQILYSFFTEEFAQRKIAHIALSSLADFDSVLQPRPRLSDVIAQYGPADTSWEADLSPFGVSERAVVHRFGRLGLATPVNRTDGEIFWTLIVAGSPN
jgi:hypothetical protein